MDVGQSTANALWQQAVDGTFKMEPDAAKKCAGVFVRFVDTTIEAQLKKAQRLNQLTGFGDFGSAQALQSGFSTKATSMIEALTSMKAASSQDVRSLSARSAVDRRLRVTERSCNQRGDKRERKMKLARSTAFIAIAVSAAALMLSGCSDTGNYSTSSSDSASDSASTRTTLTASKLQPPSQHNQYTSKGRPEIAFDPCTWISDDTITQVRVRSGHPPTRRRSDR